MDNTRPPKTVHELLHRLWTKAVDTPDYFKGDWRVLSAVLERGLSIRDELPDDVVEALWTA